MPLQVNLLKTTDDEEEEKKASESTVSVNLKNNSSSSSSSASSSSDDDEQEIEEAEPVPEPEEPEEEAPAPPPIVKPSQKKAEAEAAAAAKRPKARELTSVEKILYAKWFDGDSPTEVETVAQIFRLGEVDPERAQQAYDIYNQLKTSGQFKETYGAGNSDWIAKMNELGIEKTENLSQADLDYLYGYVRENGTVTASGSLSNAKKYGAASVAAYNVNEFLKDYEATQGLLAEQKELFKELSYWVANGYTNDEIKGKINLSKYGGLYAAQEKTKNGQYTPTTSAIPALTSYGIDGMLFAIRNPNDSKNDYFLDAVQGKLGRGVQPTATPEQIARRTAGDPAWAPYAVGTTMHDDAMLFGMTGFDRKWLDENYSRIAASGDPKLQQAFGRISDAVDFTEKAEAEAVTLKGFIEKRLNDGASPEEIFTDELLENYPSLQKMYEGQKKLNLVDVAHAVDFDLYAWQKDVEKFYKERKGTISGKDYEKTISEGLGSNMPTYEGQEELDKAEEENIKLYREVMDYTNTTPAEGAALTIKTPDFVRVAASVSTGISAGNGGYDEAYLAATAVANDYVGKHYLSAVTTRAAKQAELDKLTKPVNDFVEKWFPGQDADAVVRKLVDGEMEMQDSAEYQQDLQALYNSTNYLGTYLEDKTKLEADIANEDTILLRIDEQVKLAEELNVSGKPTQSVMPMVKFMEGFYNYDVKADYAEFGDWQYQVEANGMDWAAVSGELGTRKENNIAAIQELDVAIAKAESWGNDPAVIDNMRRARDVYELDNKLIDYAKMQDVEGFAEAVKQFDEQAEISMFAFAQDDQIKNALLGYEKAIADGLSEEYYLSSNNDKMFAPKIAMMTDNERETYKYLYMTQGAEAATEFFNTLDEAHLSSRTAAMREMRAEQATEKNPVLMNALSIMTSPYQALGVVEVVRAALTGDDIDPDSEWFAVGQVVQKVREVSQEGIVEHFGEGTTAAKIATFGYQVATSVGDSLAAAPVGGAWTMGLEAFANTAMDAAERGADTWDAILLAGITGAAEVATEYLPMGAIEDAFKTGGKEGLKGLFKSMASGLTEAPGEALSELISGVADEKIMGEMSTYAQNVQQYIQSGMEPAEAEKQATKDFWKNVGMAGLQGAFAGGVQTSATYVAGYALNRAPKKEQPKVVEEQPAPSQQEAPVEEETAPVAEEEAVEEQQAPAEQPQAPFEYTKPEVATPGALEKKAPANIRMVTALSDAQMEGVGLDKKTATVQGVFEAGGLNPELALAAAKDLAKNSPMIQKLQQAIQKADESGVLDALKAFAYRTLVPSTNVDGTTDSDVISAVENDPAKAQELANAVMNSEIATETVNVLAEMDSTAIKGNFKSVRSAKQSVNEAAKRLALLESDVESSRKALQAASAELKKNPSDSKLVNRALRIAREMKAKQMTAEQARLEVEKARGRYNDAKTTLEEESVKRANEARREAKLRVEQRMAERAAMMQQQKAAEEQQRIADEQKAAEQAAAAKNEAAQPEVSNYVGTPELVEGTDSIDTLVISPIEVARNLADTLGIGEYIGTRKMNTTNKDVQGVYAGKKGFMAVRGTQANSPVVLMHELGHAISHRIGIVGDQAMIDQLSDEMKDATPENERKFEAFAEFFWKYMTNDQAAEDFAGSSFIRRFERALRNSGYADAVHNARDEMREYVNADVNRQIGAVVKNRSDKPKTSVREWFAKTIAGVVDSTAPLETLNNAVREQTGDLSVEDNIRDVALMRNTASKRAWNILTQNSTDSSWTMNGDSLATVIEGSGVEAKDFELLNNYMLAIHSLDRDAQGLPVFDESITTERREEFIARIQNENPAVAAAERAIHNWWHNFMQTFMVDTGYLDQETLDKFEAMYPHYVPTNRVVKPGVTKREMNSGKRYTVLSAKGGTQEIYNPLDSIVSNVEAIVQMVSQNNVALTWDRLYNQYEGLGLYGRKVNQDLKRDAVAMDKVQEEVKEILNKGGVLGDVVDDVLEAIGEEQQQFRASGGVNGRNILRVQRPDGKKVFYEIQDNEMYKALANLKEPEVSSVLNFIGRITRGMGALTTGGNPLFAARNFARDYQQSVNYGSWATDYATAFPKWLRAAYDVWTGGGEYEQYKALGGGGWTRINAGTTKGADEYRNALFKGYNTSNLGRTAKWAGQKIWSTLTLERINEVVEQASRYAEYKYGQQDKSTAEGRQKAFLNAQAATVDFNRSGNSHIATELKRIIPFFNASVQGVAQTVREFTSKSERGRLPARFTKTVVNTVLASALSSVAMLKFMDDEDKEEFFWLSDDLKAEHFYLPNFMPAVFGEAPLIRVPLAQDPLSRAVHGLVTNLIWNNKGEEPVIEASVIANNIFDGFNPVSGTIFDAALAMKTNKNWYGSNIVPTRMEGWHPTTQYTEETPDMFVDLGRVTGMSPMKLQYLAEQYLGFVGQLAIPAMSKDANTGEVMGIGAVVDEARKKFTSDPLVSNDVINAFYDSADVLDQIHQAAKNSKPQYWLNRGLSAEEAKAAADEAKAMAASGGIIGSTKQMITDTFNRIDEINADTNLSDKEKYQLTSAARREMIENVLDANEIIGEYKEKYINGENMLTRAFKEGQSTSLSTSYEKLPEKFRNDYEAGELYMQRSREVWEATGKDAALPKVNTTFSINKTDYVVADEDVDAYTSYYQRRYEEGVYAIHNWDELTEDQKLEALQKAHTNAHNKAKKWYANGMK